MSDSDEAYSCAVDYFVDGVACCVLPCAAACVRLWNVCQAGAQSGFWWNKYRCASNARFCRVTMIRNPALTQHTVADYAVVFAETQKNGRKSEFALFISLVPSKSYTVFTFRRYSCVAGLKAWGNTQGGWLGLSEERWDSWTGVVVRRLYWVLGKRGNVSWNFGE